MKTFSVDGRGNYRTILALIEAKSVSGEKFDLIATIFDSKAMISLFASDFFFL